MKKNILVLTSLFVIFSIDTLAYECKNITVSCSGYNVNLNANTCPGNYIVCPFNSKAAYCDNEAEPDDLKFSLYLKSGTSLKGWTANSNAAGSFIIGYPANSSCTSTLKGKTTTTTYTSHKHTCSTSQANSDVDKYDRRAASAKDYNGYENHQSNSRNFYSEYTGGTETRPVNVAVAAYTYGALPSTVANQSASVGSEPTCSGLGYVHKKSQCPGSSVACPLNSDDVLCDLQAQAGEIKFSLYTKDHAGWIRVNDNCGNTTCTSKTTTYGGRKLKEIATDNSITTRYTNSELAKIIENMYSSSYYDANIPLKNGSDYIVPNYTALFLRIKGGDSSDYNKLQSDAFLSHRHYMHIGTYKPKDWQDQQGGNRNQDTFHQCYKDLEAHSGDGTRTTTSSDSVGDGLETRPASYAANIFIYSGLLHL